jgi:hypothetical protein
MTEDIILTSFPHFIVMEIREKGGKGEKIKRKKKKKRKKDRSSALEV